MGRVLAPWIPEYMSDATASKGNGQRRWHADDPIVRVVEAALLAVRSYATASWAELLMSLSVVAQCAQDLPRTLPLVRGALGTRRTWERVRLTLLSRVREYGAGRTPVHFALDFESPSYHEFATGSSIGLPAAAAPARMRSHTGAP